MCICKFQKCLFLNCNGYLRSKRYRSYKIEESKRQSDNKKDSIPYYLYNSPHVHHIHDICLSSINRQSFP